MELKEALKKINWKQPKYVIPVLIYIPLLVVMYFVVDLFHTEKAEIPDDSMKTTEYLNPELPDAKIKGDGVGNKYESMVKSYGKIDDYSAIDNIDRNNEDEKESYDSKYSDEERAALETEEMRRLAEMQERLKQSAKKGQEVADGQGMSEADRIARTQEREKEAMEELNRALAQARLQGQQATSSVDTQTETEVQTSVNGKVEGKIETSEKSKKDDDEPQEVVKKVKVTSDYFNTLCENEKEPGLIKAIIDENIKAVDGSRVRLRLLDDIEINEVMVPKGSYIYATMSGFGSQRVKGIVKSIMVDDEIIKVSLSLYDTDGLEGLYVPSSQFRETTKDVGSGALNNTSSLTNGGTTGGNSLAAWGTQAVSNAVQKTSNAISKAIRKNSAKLKYGTFVYLVNGKDKRND